MNRMSRLQRSSSQRLAIPKYYLGQRVMSPKINIDKEQIAQLLKGKNNNEEENLYKTFSPKCRSNEYGIIQPNNTNYSLKSRVYDQYNLYTPPNNLSPNNSREEFMVDNKFYIPENRLLRKNNSQKEFYSEQISPNTSRSFHKNFKKNIGHKILEKDKVEFQENNGFNAFKARSKKLNQGKNGIKKKKELRVYCE